MAKNLANSNELQQIFNRFDVNHDGKISSSELLNIMKSLGPSDTYTLEDVNQIMSDIDVDRDGFINLEEFAKFLKGGEDANEDGAIKEAFEMYDLNKNGLISANELHQIMSRLGEVCTVDDCVTMIGSVDSDGDGFVDFHEFKKMMSNNDIKN